MKIKQALLTVGACLAFASAAVAGIVSTEVTETPNAVFEWGSGELSVGYDSTYIFRGQSFGEDAVWSRVDYTVPLDENLYISGAAYYVNATDSDFDFDKLNLFANIGASLGAFDIEVGYIANLFPGNSASDSDEVALRVGTYLGPIDLGVAYVYHLDNETSYIEGTAGIGFELTDNIGANLGVEVGFNEDEYSHTVARLSLPVAITDTVTFTPWGAGIFRDEDTHPSESAEEFIAGASLGVRF